MTRINFGELYAFDPEIERTLRALRKHHSSSSHSSHSLHLEHIGNMATPPPERTLKELGTPDVTYPNLAITYPNTDAPFELRSGLIHLLPKFHGLAGEDPHKHLKEFHVVCSTMKPQGVQEDVVMIKAFPFSLDGLAKDWLFYL